jgi:hypothetical protein
MTTHRYIALLLMALLLGACGEATTASPTSTPIQPLSARPGASAGSGGAAPAAPTRIAVTVPTTAPLPAPTSQPAATAEASALPETTRQGYAALLILKGVADMLGDLAKNAQPATTAAAQDTGAQLGRQLAITTLFKPLEDSLAKDAPDPALQAAWEAARAAAPQLKDTLVGWSDQRLSGDDVSARLAPIQTQLGAALTAAEQRLGSSHDVDPSQLGALASDTVAKIRAALAAASE